MAQVQGCAKPENMGRKHPIFVAARKDFMAQENKFPSYFLCKLENYARH